MPDYKRPPDELDWTTTIFLYVVLIILGGGMCFCLKRANRLIPNRFSFPLADRGEVRLTEDEERGLLNNYSDSEENDAEEIPVGRYEEDELEARLAEDEFRQDETRNLDNLDNNKRSS